MQTGNRYGPVHHSRACTSAIDLPIIPVANDGSINCSLDNVANIGADEYSKKIKNSDQATDFLADFTDGVVKYLIRMCGKEAVPTIIQIANEINFQAAIPPAPVKYPNAGRYKTFLFMSIAKHLKDNLTPLFVK